MQGVLETGFWLSVLLLAWAYAGFALTASAVALLRRRRVDKAPCTPTVTVIHVAHEWDPDIESRVADALALDYPDHRLEILVAAADSVGRLPELVERQHDPRVVLVDTEGRGWAAARNAAVRAARGEVLVFPDSRSLMHPDSLRILVRNFADPEVGGACGNRVHLRSRGEDVTLRAERLYADWDKWLAAVETGGGSIACAGRILWAIRRDLYRPVRPGRNPDFASSTGVVRQGSRLVWEPRALTWERGGDAGRQFRQRVRSARGNLRALLDAPGLLNPFRHGFWSVVLFSHVVLRWLTPLLLLTLFLCSALLASDGWLYRGVAGAHLLFTALVALAWMARTSRLGRSPALSLPLFLCLGWAAALVALITSFRTMTPGSAAAASAKT